MGSIWSSGVICHRRPRRTSRREERKEVLRALSFPHSNKKNFSARESQRTRERMTETKERERTRQTLARRTMTRQFDMEEKSEGSNSFLVEDLLLTATEELFWMPFKLRAINQYHRLTASPTSSIVNARVLLTKRT